MNDAPDLRVIGDRIEVLLDELRSSLDRRAWERVEDVIGLVTELYGGGLQRVVELVPDDVAARLGADDLVGSLLILHGLHPLDLATRIGSALDSVRPYMESHGGDVEVLGIDDDGGVLQLRLLGSCDGCASSAVTLERAVREAVEHAAPEIVRIDVVADAPAAAPTSPVTLSRKPVTAG